MTDREALRSMLIYALREAEIQKLRGVADLLSKAVDGIEEPVPRAESVLCLESSQDSEFYGHLTSRRLQ